MNPPFNIRAYYNPIQPTIKASDEKISYTEFLPAPQLQPFIYCYWQLKTNEQLSEPFHYRVVADGCINIFFEIKTAHENFVMGFCRKFTEFPIGYSFHYWGVRFLPTMLPQIFSVNAKNLSNRVVALNTVHAATALFIEKNIYSNLSTEEILSLFNTHFQPIVASTIFNWDNRLYEALEIILKNHGLIDIETDLNTGISPRQLRRLFEYYLGTTAKSFSQVIRFQQILNAHPSAQSLRKNKLFFDAGYYDQAHFIKAFKTLYGVSPARAFGR